MRLIDHNVLKCALCKPIRLSGTARAQLGRAIRDEFVDQTVEKSEYDRQPRLAYALAELRATGMEVVEQQTGAYNEKIRIQFRPDAISEHLFGRARTYFETKRAGLDEKARALVYESDAYSAFELLVALYCRTGWFFDRKKPFRWPSWMSTHFDREKRVMQLLRPYGYDLELRDGGVALRDVFLSEYVRVRKLRPRPLKIAMEIPSDADFEWNYG